MSPVFWLEPFISGGADSFNVSLGLYLLEMLSEVCICINYIMSENCLKIFQKKKGR